MRYVLDVLLYLLISGDILFLGLSLVVVGVVVAANRRSAPGGAFLWSGIGLALLSAVPIHPALYAALVLFAGAWQVGRTRNRTLERSVTTALLLAVAVVLGTALATRGPSSFLVPRNTPVFVLGDSISAGLGSSKDGTWPQLLSERVSQRVANLARAGATLADSPSQMRAIPQGPAVVLVELGGNDLLAGTSPDKRGTRRRRDRSRQKLGPARIGAHPGTEADPTLVLRQAR